MTLHEATSAFLDQIRRDHPPHRVEPIELFDEYLRGADLISNDQLAASTLRDFLARWYVEMASAPAAHRKVSSPQILLGSIGEFLKWADEQAVLKIASEHEAVLSELQESLPRALEINSALSRRLGERGGAFGFPEFLTSFDEGGHSEYDIGEPGEVRAIEGYFLVERVEQSQVQALEIVSDKRVGPIIFPEEVARLIGEGFIINLEIVRAGDSWQITDCGFAFPPNTEVLSDES
ncbi:MAG TPA: hypothetical protein VF131_16150 [Blastocatellia bacterium]|nr:hypothetical protein [Blastocatellia bacterium]